MRSSQRGSGRGRGSGSEGRCRCWVRGQASVVVAGAGSGVGLLPMVLQWPGRSFVLVVSVAGVAGAMVVHVPAVFVLWWVSPRLVPPV